MEDVNDTKGKDVEIHKEISHDDSDETQVSGSEAEINNEDDTSPKSSHKNHEDSKDINDNDSHDGSNGEGTKMSKIEPFSLTYQRGSRHVYVASKRQGAMTSTLAKHLDKGKEKVKEEE